ncbi:uncharacterized protein LOC127095724 [Lathyrus oleraceus]|uniref:uncharacterized protein LOC127095724 n=1 Tax=Pisum sativum TaxID=3888 RepID=UPI0021D3B112|nr:uncharacterized protein LOC127095724 [Pisum sativum]
MHRSASWNRFSDDYFQHATSSSSSSLSPALRSSSNNLPTHDPIVELAKREKARVKFSENAVHAIPLVLLLCAVILWICSSPDVGNLGDSMGSRLIEGLNLDGEFEGDSDGTQAGFLPVISSEEEITTQELRAEKDWMNLKNF